MMIDEILIEIHNTEHNYTLALFVEYFKAHKVEHCRFDISEDGGCPDIRISINGQVVHVVEIKHKADARSSRDSKHLYNNFNKMLRDYPNVKKWFILVDHKKKSLRWNNTLKRKTMQWNLDPTLIGQMMHEGFSRGFETKYVTKEWFVQLVFDIINVDPDTNVIDEGVHYLEKKGAYKPKKKSRGRCSTWETSLPSYRMINPKKAYRIALKWSNMFEFVKAGSVILDDKGRKVENATLVANPEQLDMSEFIPNNISGGKTKYWAIFMQETFGIKIKAKAVKKRKKKKKSS